VSTVAALATRVTRIGPARLRSVAAPVVAVAATNLAIYLLGRLGGAAFTYTQNGTTMHVDAASVLIMSSIPLALGLAVVAVVSPRWRPIVTIAKVVAPTLAIATIAGMTIPAGFDRPSAMLLAVMHLVVIPGALWAITRLSRPTSATQATQATRATRAEREGTASSPIGP
jgi:hypothetical protein